MEVEIGIKPKACKEIVEAMKDFLATTYALYLKTQTAHWNVVGKEFFSLHLLFEKQYEEMADGVDEIAERIRSLGSAVEANFTEFKKRSLIVDGKGKWVAELLQGHETIARMGRPLITKTQELHDDVTADLLIRRMAFHEKAAWMLRSQLE
jgi:starvation-inducible DNA-binding protein